MIQSSDENDILGTLVEELIAQQRDGRPSQLEAFCEQYPEHAGRLRNLFETIGVIEKSKSRTDDSADDAHIFRE